MGIIKLKLNLCIFCDNCATNAAPVTCHVSRVTRPIMSRADELSHYCNDGQHGTPPNTAVARADTGDVYLNC